MLHNANINVLHWSTQSHTIILCYFLAKKKVTLWLQNEKKVTLQSYKSSTPTGITGIALCCVVTRNYLSVLQWSTRGSTLTGITGIKQAKKSPANAGLGCLKVKG